MISRIPEILRARPRTLSFEIYPPRNASNFDDLYRLVEEFQPLDPDYVSVTYRAGGSGAEATLEVSREIQERFGITVMHHLTLVNQTVEDLTDIITRIADAGILNILALRGDPPPEMGGEFRVIDGGLEHTWQLMDLIRDVAGDRFAIGIAGYPEPPARLGSGTRDLEFLRVKMEHGAEFLVTQMFFDNEVFWHYMQRISDAALRIPLIAGLLPVTDYEKLLRFCDMAGAYICDEVHKTFSPIREDPHAVLEHGTAWASRQARDLLRGGARGIHFYTLNKAEPVRTIWETVADLRTQPVAPG